jgi:hypothetical protein
MRPIKTVFYNGRDDVHTNSSSNPNRAVAQCVAHMQVNHYGATAAEVYDHTTGELHAVIKRHVQGNINIVYKRDPLAFEPMRLAASAILSVKTTKRSTK